jgi:hypothetical protein
MVGQKWLQQSDSTRLTPTTSTVSKHGRICHPVFDREWANTIHVYEVLQHIFGMLMSLESRDAIDELATLRFYEDPAEGRRLVSNYITRFASAPLEVLEAEILSGNDTSSLAPSDISRDDDVMSVASDATIQATPQGSSKDKWSFKSSSVVGTPDAQVSKPVLFHAKAVQTYQSFAEGHLGFTEGQFIRVTNTGASSGTDLTCGWWEGEYTTALGKVIFGRFPSKSVVRADPPQPPGRNILSLSKDSPPYRAKAIYTYHSTHATDLQFEKDQDITVTAKFDKDWLRGELIDTAGNTKSGIFPAAYVVRVGSLGSISPFNKLRSSIKSGSRSSISGYLSSQRNPGRGGEAAASNGTRPPPLMSLGGAGPSSGQLPLTESNLANVPGAEPPSDGWRVIGRRASFFGMLKKAGGTK